ncbi:MAG: efflux RND transporter periplasmic adaptor subunit [Betaproteobacteria bacterium]
MIYLLLGLGVTAVFALAFVSDPVMVDVAMVARGELQVTVDEDGETRARDRYVISAPVAGRVKRIDLREGDPVRADQVVAEIRPLPLSARERDEQLARITAAQALAREARERARHAAADHEQARRELQRVEKLARDGFVSAQAFERAQVSETTAANEWLALDFHARSAEADARSARAALMAIGGSGLQGAVSLRSPIAGRVFRISERSERVVAPGAVLMMIGSPEVLEIVLQVLSGEAVKIKPGMPVLIGGWGGSGMLQARVRLVEPFAFTKVSALGVEEQRVNVVADFMESPQDLGDGYRVEARIVLWSGRDVLKVASSALFRRGDDWAVFVMDGRHARLRLVKPGHRAPLETEVLEGLVPGERVIVHPPNDIADGARVRSRR